MESSPNVRIARAIAAVCHPSIDANAIAAHWPEHGVSELLVAHLIGQTAHETGGFRHLEENLNYSGARLVEVFSFYQRNPALADAHHRQPELIANHAYANRNGNGPISSGDGWRYRGRGFQLTGRGNYARMEDWTGLSLVSDPDMASEPEHLWALAIAWFENTRFGGKSLVQWAELNDSASVTAGINGAARLHTSERANLTKRALRALRGEEPEDTTHLQRSLANAGYDPGPIDGIYGPRTDSAVISAMSRLGVSREDLVAALNRKSAEPAAPPPLPRPVPVVGHPPTPLPASTVGPAEPAGAIDILPPKSILLAGATLLLGGVGAGDAEGTAAFVLQAGKDLAPQVEALFTQANATYAAFATALLALRERLVGQKEITIGGRPLPLKLGLPGRLNQRKETSR